MGPVLSGYIVYHSIWPVYYWYNLALDLAVMIILFLFLEETEASVAKEYLDLDKENWLRRRLYLIPGIKSSRYDFSASFVVSQPNYSHLNAD